MHQTVNMKTDECPMNEPAEVQLCQAQLILVNFKADDRGLYKVSIIWLNWINLAKFSSIVYL